MKSLRDVPWAAAVLVVAIAVIVVTVSLIHFRDTEMQLHTIHETRGAMNDMTSLLNRSSAETKSTFDQIDRADYERQIAGLKEQNRDLQLQIEKDKVWMEDARQKFAAMGGGR